MPTLQVDCQNGEGGGGGVHMAVLRAGALHVYITNTPKCRCVTVSHLDDGYHSLLACDPMVGHRSLLVVPACHKKILRSKKLLLSLEPPCQSLKR